MSSNVSLFCDQNVQLLTFVPELNHAIKTHVQGAYEDMHKEVVCHSFSNRDEMCMHAVPYKHTRHKNSQKVRERRLIDKTIWQDTTDAQEEH